MITFIRKLFAKKQAQKRVLEKVKVNTPFEKKTAPATKKPRKKKNA